MRASHLIDRYRDFAARTHAAMGAFALCLIAAIIALMIVSAVPSRADFLAAEAKNIVTITPTSDHVLLSVVALVFLAVIAAKIIDHRNAAR